MPAASSSAVSRRPRLASPSSDRMSFSGCFAKDIVVDPRLPFATRTISQSALMSMRVNSFQLIKFCCTQTDPATETESIGLQADPAFGEGRRSVALFFARHLDCFIVTQNSHPSPGLSAVKSISS